MDLLTVVRGYAEGRADDVKRANNNFLRGYFRHRDSLKNVFARYRRIEPIGFGIGSVNLQIHRGSRQFGMCQCTAPLPVLVEPISRNNLHLPAIALNKIVQELQANPTRARSGSSCIAAFERPTDRISRRNLALEICPNLAANTHASICNRKS